MMVSMTQQTTEIPAGLSDEEVGAWLDEHRPLASASTILLEDLPE